MADLENLSHEPRDLSSKVVMGAAIGLIIALIVTLVAMRAFEGSLIRSGGAAGATRILGPSREVPAPRLQVSPAIDLAQMRAAQDSRLHSYGWIDRKGGLIHIPIERAIELTAERGLPVRQSEKGGTP